MVCDKANRHALIQTISGQQLNLKYKQWNVKLPGRDLAGRDVCHKQNAIHLSCLELAVVEL